MEKIYKNLSMSSLHLSILDYVFLQKNNYTDKGDYKLYTQNIDKISRLSEDIGFAQELYDEKDRQMKLADVIEYIFFSRGIFSLINNNNQLIEKNIPKFLELIFRFVNLLILYEIMTTDSKIRHAYLSELAKGIKGISKEKDFRKLSKWNKWVGLPKKDEPKGAPSEYFDTLLPKTAGGLWHEMLVYAFVLRFNLGYIFPLLLHQKVLSLKGKLSPPDLIILHKKTDRYYGIEIGNLKERQSGGFMVPSGIPVIPLDTLNCRMSDRCPTCKKWIGICGKVIDEFSDITHKINKDSLEIRCLYECDRYTLEEKIGGKCPYMKYYDGLHHHYKCVVIKKQQDVIRDIVRKHKITKDDLETIFVNREKNLPSKKADKRSKKINYLKTHQLWYPELSKLM